MIKKKNNIQKLQTNIKNKIIHYHLILVIVFVCFIFTIPLFHRGFYISHDSEPQLARMTAVYKAISDGHIPPRWAGDLNFRYGLPSPNFFFPLNGYLLSLLYSVGLSLQDSFKILMGLSLILSAVFFYLWMSEVFEKKTAFFASLFYGVAPYHLLNIYVRGQLGETLAFVFVPLLFYFLEKIIKHPKVHWLVFGSFSYALLVISHNILGLLFSFIVTFYLLLRSWKKWNSFLSSVLMLLGGLMLSVFFWLPALYESRYINSQIFVGDFYKDHFIKPFSVFYAEWGYGSNINEEGGLSPYIGIVQGIILLISIFLFFHSSSKKFIGFWILVTLGSLFMTQAISGFLWEKFHILEQFQFPWRFLAIASFSLPVLAGYVISKIKNIKILVLIIVSMLFMSILLIHPKGYVSRADSFYLNYPWTGAYHGESTTIWTAGDFSSYPESPVEIIGDGRVSNYLRDTHRHQFTVEAISNVRVIDNTVYYPGWSVYVNNMPSEIQFQDPNHRGLITFQVDKGIHQVRVVFKETKVRVLANLVSFLTMCILIVTILLRKKIENFISFI